MNLGSASLAILGTILALAAGSAVGDMVPKVLVPVTAGGFFYIAAADLIPELQRERGLRALVLQAVLISTGIGVMSLLTLID